MRRLILAGSKRGRLIDLRRLKKKDNCSKLNKTNMLSEKISVQFIHSKNSSPSIDTSRPSRDRHIALLNLNFDLKVLIQSHCALIVSLSLL